MPPKTQQYNYKLPVKKPEQQQQQPTSINDQFNGKNRMP
jgi:hypothetical protein